MARASVCLLQTNLRTFTLGSKAINAALSCKYKAELKKGANPWRVLATDGAGIVATKNGSAKLTAKEGLG